MNTQYRLVWNKSRGVVQVASELTHRPKGGAAGANGTAASQSRVMATVRPLRCSLWVALGFVAYASVATAGQIVGDPNAPGTQRPTVLGSSGKAALINITTPSKAGVSINQYSAFQVDAQGAILNNSRENTTTQLGGAIGGNPWLAAGSARVIVNQVNSASPAQLGGYIEVAGQKAQVVIASPSGIAVDGGGFLNSSRVSLVAGSPIITDGALEGYRVSGNGVIQVTGNGLDASRVDYTDIIARAAVLDGAIFAQQLQATLGANQVSVDQSQVTAIQGSGTAPTLALDSSALGGMYVNKIMLVSSEHGVGVRNAGKLVSAGDVVVTLDGRLENAGTVQSQTDTTIGASGGITNSGTFAATNTLTLTTPKDLDNSDGSLNAGRIVVDADSLRNAGGTIAQTGLQGMSLQAGTLSNAGGTIGAPVPDASGGTDSPPDSGATPPPSESGNGSETPPPNDDTTPGDAGSSTPPAIWADGVLRIANRLDNDGGRISAAAGFDLTSTSGLVNDGGNLTLRQLSILGADLTNRAGKLAILGPATIQGGNVINDAGTLSFADALTFKVQNLSNRGGQFILGNAAPLTLGVSGALDNTDGLLASNAASLTLTSGTLINERGAITHAGTEGFTLRTGDWQGANGTVTTAGAATVQAGTVDHRGATFGATRFNITAEAWHNQGGTLVAAGDQANTLTVRGLLDNSDDGVIGSNADLAVQAGTLDNTHGAIQHVGDGTLRIDAATLNGSGGEIQSNGALWLTGNTINQRNGTTYAQAITIDAGSLTTAGGQLTALGNGPLQITVRGLFDNTHGTVETNGALQVAAQSLINTHGSLSAAGTDATTVTVATTFDNTQGTLAAMGATTVHGGDILNQGGVVQAAGAPLTVTADGLLDNSAEGLLTSDDDLTVRASTLDNSAGTIAHAGDGALTIDATTLNGTGGTLASNGALTLTGNAINLRDGTTYAQAITINTGSLTTAGGYVTALGSGPLQITARGLVDNANDGHLVTNGALLLTAGALSNAHGEIRAAGADGTTLTVATAFDNTHGLLATAGPTALHAGSADNTGGVIAASSNDALTLSVDGLLTNDTGTLVGNGDLVLTAGALTNHAGVIQTQQAIGANVAGTLDNSDSGAIIAGDNLVAQAGTLLNRNSLVTDPTDPDAAPQGLYGQHVWINAGTLDNTVGGIHAIDELAVSGVLLTNAGGVMDGQNVTLNHFVLNNAGGTIIQRGDSGALTVISMLALTNTNRGLIGAGGTARIESGTIDNSGGTTYAAHDLTLTTGGTLTNTADGQVQSGGNLDLKVGDALVNDAGHIDVAGAATIQAAAITNTHGGQILAGNADDPDAEAALLITTQGGLAANGAMTNDGGTIGNRVGDVIVQAARVDNGAGGQLVAQRDLNLDDVGTLSNSGKVVAAHDLSFQNSSATLTNTGSGQLGAGDTVRLDLAQLNNTNGGQLQADTLWLTTPTLAVDGGEVDARVLHATFADLTGLGRLYGTQLLDVHVTGDYTHRAGQQFDSDDLLALRVDGTLTNQGSLQTPGELDVAAATIINTDGAVINASNDAGTGVAHLTATDRIDNQRGASLESDTLGLSATDITNTGDIVGDAVRIEADRLTNGRDLGTADASEAYGEGFIGASQTLDFRIAQRLANLDGEIYSGGDITIGGRTDGSRVGALDNISGRIQADRDLIVAADVLTNTRRGLRIDTLASLTPEQQAALLADLTAQANGDAEKRLWVEYCKDAGPALGGCEVDTSWPNAYYQPTVTLLSGAVVQSAAGSERSVMLAGRDMSLTVGTLRNEASSIAAVRDLYVKADGDIINLSATGTLTYQVMADYRVGVGTCTNEAFGCSPQWGAVTGTLNYIDTVGTALADGRATLTAGGNLLLDVGGNYIEGDGDTLDRAERFPRNPNDVTAGDGGSGLDPNDPLNGPGSHDLGDATHADAQLASTASTAPGQRVSSLDGSPLDADAPALGALGGPAPSLVPPSKGKVSTNPDPSAPFLRVTTPRFAQGPVTSSDYLLRALGTDPANMHKRLGDGYYEQNLVLDQLLQLTGRRTLNGGDGLATYQALMDGAAAEAARLGLQLGAPLTASQISALSSDIVWLVDQVVDGQHVLVPVVYLTKATTERMASDGALTAGDNVTIKAGGAVFNDGTLTGTQSLGISADTLINTGLLSGGDRLAIATRNDTLNSGTLTAKRIGITAGGSVVNAPTGVIAAGTGGAQIVAARDVLNGGSIASKGDALVVAGRDVLQTSTGSVSAAGNAALIAGRDVILDQSTLNAGKIAYVDAGRDAIFNAATVSGGTGIGVKAGRDIISDAVIDHTTDAARARQGNTTTTTVTTTDTIRGSTFTSGGNISMQAGRDIDLLAATVQADGAVGLKAERDVNLLAGENVLTQVQDTRNISGGSTTHRETVDIGVVGTTISGTQGVVIDAGRDVNANATSITSSDGGVLVHADRDINLLAGQNVHSETEDSSTTKTGFLSKKQTTTHDATLDTTAVGTVISGKEGIALDAGRNVLGVGATLQSSDGGILVTAGDKVSFLAAADTHSEEHSESVRRSGFEVVPNPNQGTQKKTTLTQQVTAVRSTLDASGPILVMSGGDQTYQAANIKSETGTALVSGGAINFVTATNSDSYTRDASKHNVAYAGQDHIQRLDTTEVQTAITGPLVMSAADGITIGVGQKPGETQEEAIARASQQRDGTQWIADVEGQGNVSFQSIDEYHINEHQHHEGLTPAAGAVVTIATAYFTAGAASSWIGSASGSLAGSGTALAAGTSASATGAAVSAGWANATLSGIAAGSFSQGLGAAAQGYDWRTPALYGGITGGLTGYLSAGTYYSNPINSLKDAGGFVASGEWAKLGSMGLNIVTTQAAGRLESKVANELGLNGDQLNWLLMAASIVGNQVTDTRYKTVTDELQQGEKDFGSTGGTGMRGYDNRGSMGLLFDTIDVVLGYQGLPDASVASAAYNHDANGINQPRPQDLTCHSLGTVTCSYLARNGLAEGNLYLASVPFGVVAPTNTTVFLGNGDAVNGFYGGMLFNWNGTVVPIQFITGHPYENYKPYVDAAAEKIK